MTVEAMPLVAENTIAPVSAVQYSVPRRSDLPGPDVDDGLAVQVDGKRAAAEPASGEQLREGPHGAGEVRVRRALYAVRERCAALPAIDTPSQCIEFTWNPGK